MYIKQLAKNDIGLIMGLEAVCFSPSLRASKETLVQRFALGHIMLGLYVDKALVGVASFAYRWFDSKADTRVFAKNEWRPFYQLQMPKKFNTVVIYNVELLPSKRGRVQVYTLLNAMMKRAFEDGCQYLIGISRIPSYNGDVFNHVAQKPALKTAVDNYFSGGEIPNEQELIQDPLIRLYKNIGNCEVLTLMNDYLPEDTPSGGIRAIVYTELVGQWETNVRQRS